jgi:dipeptidyl aminopeptidase/acylaminoacyl peptidase
MSKLTTVAALASIAVTAAAPATKVTVDDLMRLRTIVDAKISPDARVVAFVVSTPSVEKDEHDAVLYVVPAAGGTPARLAGSARILNVPLPTPRLRWSPDGTMVAFLAFSGERPQVFAAAVAGGEAHALTTAPEGVSAYEWSPDGKSLAYLSRDPMSPEEERQRKDKSFVIHADAPDRATRLYVQAIDTAPNGPAPAGPHLQQPRVLTPPAQYVDSLAWSPDGREIAYSAAPITGFMGQYATRIYAVQADGSDAGAPRLVVDRGGMNTTPRYSPDGSQIAFVSTNGRSSLMTPRSLTVAPARAPTAIRIFSLDDAWVSDVTWAPDGQSVYVTTIDGTFASHEHMFDVPIVRVRIGDGRAERVTEGATANYSLSVSRDGGTIAYRSVEARTMGDVFVRDMRTGRNVRITDVNPELRQLELGELSAIRWRSFDGMEIWGLLLTPPHRTAGQKLPLLVYCHGGPNGSITWGVFPQFMHVVSQIDPYPSEALASAGFAVLMPMPRGSAGYGEAGQRSIVNAWGEADYKDVMAGVDDLVSRGIADPDRLGVMGASYGGYMTNWIVTQTTRFKAASAGASISDLADQYFLSDGGDVMAEYFKRPWEARDSYAMHSPITHAGKVTTPLLIQHGERDQRVPIANAWKFYRALKALGRTVELDIYPRGGHVLYEPMLEREQMKRNLEWFLKWIKP